MATKQSGLGIGDRVRLIMIETFDLAISPKELGDEVSLYSPLIQMDSLSLLRLIIAFEGEFGDEIDDEDVMGADLETVRDLIDLVRSKFGGVGESK